MLRDERSWLNQKADGGERAEGGTLPKKLCYTVLLWTRIFRWRYLQSCKD